MKTLPRVELAHLPTPVHPMPRLSAHLGGPELWIKRDDLTGLAFGGNKTRKLETLCAAAQTEKADLLITAGAIQSNHCRQTAAAAARLGFDCVLVLVGQAPEIPSANLMLDQLLGAEIRWVSKAARDDTLQSVFAETKAIGRRPFLIPYGGSNPIGAAAYAFALKELMGQDLNPDWIVFASSSGGTQAGLLAGARLLGYRGTILGISVDEHASNLKPRIVRLSKETMGVLGENLSVTENDVLVNDDYLGGGYAVMGDPEREAIELFAQYEGILVDPVYTGRAAAGFIDLIRKGLFNKADRVLFWHTGGTPALFADTYRKDLGAIA
ncbi:MAG: D-cysteine desulfhydrase family protein [Chloroflexi bacterium]|nr:D-cysteine desulfhydrase family protein [Chloroflexota bacterium]